MSSFVAALWTCNTSHDQQHCKKAVWLKLAGMEKALAACQQRINTRANDLSTTNEFQAIFAAPEYYFTGVGAHRVPMSEADKVNLEHSLLKLSVKYPKTLIVPGSVYYAKPLIRAANAPKLDRQTRQVVPAPNVKDRREKTTQALTKVGLREMNQEKDLGSFLVFQEGGAGVGNISGLMVPSIMDKQAAVHSKNPLILRNSTYLYLNGKRYGKYDKQSDFHESLHSPDELVFVSGTKDECPQVGPHRFGVEICLDHAMSRLKKRNPVGLDFHLVVSDHVNNQQTGMAMAEFGYFLHASSAASETQVMWRNDAGALVDLTNDNQYWFDSQVQGTGSLDFWCLPLPSELKTAELARKAAAKTQQGGMNRARTRKVI